MRIGVPVAVGRDREHRRSKSPQRFVVVSVALGGNLDPGSAILGDPVLHEIAGQTVERDPLRLKKPTDLPKSMLEPHNQRIKSLNPARRFGVGERRQSLRQAPRKGGDVRLIAADLGERLRCRAHRLDRFRIGWGWFQFQWCECRPEQSRRIGDDRQLLGLRIRHEALKRKGARHLRQLLQALGKLVCGGNGRREDLDGVERGLRILHQVEQRSDRLRPWGFSD